MNFERVEQMESSNRVNSGFYREIPEKKMFTKMMPHNSSAEFLILMADDDDDDRLLARDALQESGFKARLEFVSDGVELLSRLRAATGAESIGKIPDLLLLDLNMPRLDGRAALLEIKRDPMLCQLPVVVMTTSSARLDINTCYASGANSYITKANTFQGLVQTMRNLDCYWAETVQLPSR